MKNTKQIKTIIDTGVSKDLLEIRKLIEELNEENFISNFYKINEINSTNGNYSDIFIVLMGIHGISNREQFLFDAFKKVLLGYIDSIINNAKETTRCGFCGNIVENNKCNGCNYEY